MLLIIHLASNLVPVNFAKDRRVVRLSIPDNHTGSEVFQRGACHESLECQVSESRSRDGKGKKIKGSVQERKSAILP